MESSQSVSKLLNRIRNVFWSVFVNDALCMPVHWYYDLEALQKDYGWVDKYVAPAEVHPLTLKYPMLKKSDDPTVDIVGKHILHNKRQVQEKKGCHYHAELKAGDTTLNCDIMLVAMKEIINAKDKTNSWDANAFLEAYIKFLTTPGTHNDTYFESVHYNFVTNYLRKNPLDKCAGDEKSVAPAAAVFKFVIPALFAPLLDSIRASKAKGDDKFELSNELKDKCVEIGIKQTALLYSGDRIKKDVENFFRVLLNVIGGADLKKSIEEIGGKYFKKDFAELAKDERSDNEIVQEEFHNSCDTNGAVPLAYFVSYKYADDFNKAILVNANMGGENLGRGSVIGPILSGWLENLNEDNEWVKKLNRKDEFKKVIEDFIAL